MTTYPERIIIALSTLLNVVLGGHSNQTFAARNYMWKRHGRWNLVLVIDTIFWFDPNHCSDAWTYWILRKE